MIKEIAIKGFQSHKDTKMEFSPGVNVIVGLSNDGKSAIFRSIYWGVNNRPLGDSVVNRGGNSASVEITNDRGAVKRAKRGNKNTYVINGDEEHPLSSFGTDPPPMISELFNMSAINFQRQFEPYFLVFDPPGQVALYIREIAKLDEIDKVIDIITKLQRKNRDQTASLESELSGLEVEIEKILQIDLDGFEKLLNSAKILINRNGEINAEIVKLTGIINLLRSIEDIFLPRDVDSVIESAHQAVNRHTETKSKVTCLDGIIKSIILIESSIIVIPTDTDELLNNLSATMEKNKIIDGQLEELLCLVDSIDKININIANLTEEEEIATNQAELVRNSLTNCPLCGSELDEEKRGIVCQAAET